MFLSNFEIDTYIWKAGENPEHSVVTNSIFSGGFHWYKLSSLSECVSFHYIFFAFISVNPIFNIFHI